MPGAKQINDIGQAMSRLVGARPSTDQTTITLPFGTAVKRPSPTTLLGFTTGGVPAATQDSDGNLILGMGIAREYYLAYTLGTSPETSTVKTVYAGTNDISICNLATLEVQANAWIICELISGLWVVTWEQCPTT